jgi:hypothetical protein
VQVKIEMITDYHSKYLASDLVRRRSSDSSDKLAVAVAGAQVDMNPHQVDVALFAFASPLSKGALLADEVGLGKTIEAGLVISQRWAEGKRRVLIIAPSNLRKQWYQEMNEKFFIPCSIIESKSYNAAIKAGDFRPFDLNDSVVICSYQFVCNKAVDVHSMHWDLVVIDEANRLRNVYKPSNVIANTLKIALAERHKLLLTATPLQNSKSSSARSVGSIPTARTKIDRRKTTTLPALQASRASGRVIRASSPPSGRLVSEMSPRASRTIARASARPRPMPPVSRLRDPSRRVNGSNTCSR